MANDTLNSLTVLADKPAGISFVVDKKTLLPRVEGFDSVIAENKETRSERRIRNSSQR